MSFREQLYLSLPNFLQQAAVAWQGRAVRDRRYGDEFFRVYRRSEARLAWTPGQVEDYRAWRLSKHFKYARHSPFWAESFALHGVNVDASDPFAELAKLPVISKEDVRVNFRRIQNPAFQADKLVRLSTSGTTGAGLAFRETPESEWERWSVWWRYRRKIGIEFDTLCGHFSGRSIVPLSQHEPPYWRHSSYTRQIIFSPYHLNERTVGAYIGEIRAHKVAWLHGYPSTMTMLASLMLDGNIAPPESLRVVTTGAENLSDHQRTIISRGLGAPVFEHYGLAESSANFSQEPNGRIYIDEDFSGVELLSAEGADQSAIIGTNWHNHAFPLFRYDCGDFCRLTPLSPNTSAGMHSREVLAIDGRQEDVLVLSNGVRVGRLDHIFKYMSNIRAAQILQSTPGEAVFHIVRGADYTEADERQLRREIQMRIGFFCRFHIVYVPSVPRTKSGKLRLVVSTIASNSQA